MDAEAQANIVRIVRILDSKRVSRDAYREMADACDDLEREYKGTSSTMLIFAGF
jgi:histone H3/H4